MLAVLPGDLEKVSSSKNGRKKPEESGVWSRKGKQRWRSSIGHSPVLSQALCPALLYATRLCKKLSGEVGDL